MKLFIKVGGLVLLLLAGVLLVSGAVKVPMSVAATWLVLLFGWIGLIDWSA